MIKLPLDICRWHKDLQHSVTNLYRAKFRISASSIKKEIDKLLAANYKLWRLEDEARRKDVPDSYIADIKREIDRTNQSRNDIIEKIDALLKADVEKKLGKINSKLPMNSETPGSIFDRLTILALRAYSLKKILRTKGINKNHFQRCKGILKEVEERSNDLIICLETLLKDIYAGKKKLKSYKQHKLYNDPSFNPVLKNKI